MSYGEFIQRPRTAAWVSLVCLHLCPSTRGDHPWASPLRKAQLGQQQGKARWGADFGVRFLLISLQVGTTYTLYSVSISFFLARHIKKSYHLRVPNKICL